MELVPCLGMGLTRGDAERQSCHRGDDHEPLI
jgi:hypothetical protein